MRAREKEIKAKSQLEYEEQLAAEGLTVEEYELWLSEVAYWVSELEDPGFGMSGKVVLQ